MSTTIDGVLKKSLLPTLRISYFIFGFSLLLLAIFAWRLPDFVPIFFSRPFGLKQLAPSWSMGLYPITLFVFSLISQLIYKKSHQSVATIAIYMWLSTASSLILLTSEIYVLFLIY
jgi:hypothetical protein